MLRALPQFRSVVTMVPQSGVQFLDFGLNTDPPFKVNATFLEEVSGTGADRVVTLHGLIADQGDLRHPVSGALVDNPALYSFNAAKGLEPFLGRWMPVPFLRILGQDADGRDVYDEGPTNWARAYVTALGEQDGAGHTHRVVLAFDTAPDSRPRVSGQPYPAPTLADVTLEAQFTFCADPADVAAFGNEPWIDQWLKKAFDEFRARRARGRAVRFDADEKVFEHTARYLTYLKVLEQGSGFPRIRLIDTVSRERSHLPIGVDLVIDVGNSRTCGILIESDPDDSDRLDLAKSYVLSMRDLSQPASVYAQAFESRIEFSKAAFGDAGISRLSGRANAFHWPSFARVGPEAVRLGASSSGTEGSTGLSSAKRYLWDRRPLNQLWRFRTPGALGPEPAVSGPLLAFVTEEGDVLRQLRSPAPSAIRAKFSRSSLFTFLMCEVILQTLCTINAPESRGRQRNADVPRQLRRIIMTIPPAMPLSERRIMQSRVEGAVKLVWQALGWTEGAPGAGPEPRALIAYDEATCTQIVYLYTEITQKFRGGPADFFDLMGKSRAEGARKTLRVASIDIGGGTTDLMVIDYGVEGRKAVVPTQLFREGFKVAGDDILEAVVARHVLPPIEEHLSNLGHSDARSFLRGLVGADRGGQSVQERQLRRRFVAQVAVPTALALLHIFETLKPFSDAAPETRRLADLTGEDGTADPGLFAEVDALAAAGGAAGFSLRDTPVTFAAESLAASVRALVGPLLDDLAEIVHSLDCDVLLLSGRPSRLPVVSDLVHARVPVRPDRIVAMHQYRVGRWYPFRDAHDRIDDPKTTVAVGALLCSVARSQIEGLSIDTNRFSVTSTAKFIGEIELGGQIKAENVLFADVDLDRKVKQDDSARRIAFDGTITIGFRQLPLERWPATPLYVMEFANPGQAGRFRLPLTVSLERVDPDGEDEAKKEDFRISEVEDAEGTPLRISDVSLRLQTMKSVDGYWLDTGVIAAY